MEKVISWIKSNKLVIILLLVIGYLILSNRRIPTPLLQTKTNYDITAPSAVSNVGLGGAVSVTREAAPQPEAGERMVVEHSNISLVVDNVRQKVDQILNYVQDKGGYMVSSSISRPEEVPYGTVVVRVPSDQLRLTLEHLRGLAIKVTSENLSGRDVTDQYIDIEERLDTLNQTKSKFEEILDKATEIEDILQVQKELINLQQQIDNLKGQQQYLEKTAENAKITIYLSTDEWSLPYAPETGAFRPRVIFKQAVRSLVLTLRKFGKAGIWIVVYSPLWLPVILLFWWWKRRGSK
jgi:hypothetical protein